MGGKRRAPWHPPGPALLPAWRQLRCTEGCVQPTSAPAVKMHREWQAGVTQQEDRKEASGHRPAQLSARNRILAPACVESVYTQSLKQGNISLPEVVQSFSKAVMSNYLMVFA